MIIAVGKAGIPPLSIFYLSRGTLSFQKGVDEKHQENEMSSREQNLISLDEELQWERFLSQQREYRRFGDRKTKIAPIGRR